MFAMLLRAYFVMPPSFFSGWHIIATVMHTVIERDLNAYFSDCSYQIMRSKGVSKWLWSHVDHFMSRLRYHSFMVCILYSHLKHTVIGRDLNGSLTACY